MLGCADEQSPTVLDQANANPPPAKLSTSEPSGDPVVRLKESIAGWIRLLDQGQYRQLMETCMQPRYIAEANERDEWTRILDQFTEVRAAKLKTVLQVSLALEPKFDETGMIATFDLPEEVFTKDKISFLRAGDDWYLVGK